MLKNTLVSLKIYIFLTIITGVVYPLVCLGIGQLTFSHQVQGSLIYQGDQVLGSELIGQNFTSDKYFWSRPSAIDYNPATSGGSNLGPSSADLKAKVDTRRSNLKASSLNNQEVPFDLLTTSGSGLDPHISVAAAKFQINRVLAARNLQGSQEGQLNELIDSVTEKRTFGILGEERVNVLKLNLALDKQSSL